MGWHVAVSRLAWAAYSQADTLVVGRTMGDAVLGPYRLAINLASAPGEKIGMLIMRVSGPLFAKIQKDTAMVQRYFLIFTEVLSLIVFPVMFGLATVAPQAVEVVLGPKWAGAVAPLRWLAVFTGVRILTSLMGQVLTSLRFTGFSMWISLLNLAIMLSAFAVASRWGAGAVAATWILLSPATVGPSAIKLIGAIRLRYRDYFAALTPALAGSVGVIAMAFVMSDWLPKTVSPAVSLAVQVFAGALAYAAIVLAGYRERVLRYVRFFQRLRTDRLRDAESISCG
jgi:O-antigen/teichoic acid export membrane protein